MSIQAAQTSHSTAENSDAALWASVHDSRLGVAPACNEPALLCQDSAAQAELGMAFRQAGAPKEAADAFRKALRLRPDWAEVHALLAVTLQELGQPDAAVASYQRALVLTPEDAQGHSNLGVLLHALGRSEEACVAYERAIQIDPCLVEAYANLGATQKAMGNLDAAIDSLRKAVELRPTYAEAHANLGSCYHVAGRMVEAAISLRVASILKPNYAEAFRELAIVTYALRRPAEAVQACRAAITLGMETPQLYLLMGVALQDLDRQDEAVAAYRRVIDIDPSSPDAYSNLGVVLLEQSQHDQAINAFRRAVALMPEHPHAAANLGIALHEQGRREEAAHYFEQALASHPEQADVHSNFAMLRVHEGRFGEALSLLGQAASLNQDHGRKLPAPAAVPRYRMKHDAEQLQFLRDRGLLSPEFIEYAEFVRELAAQGTEGNASLASAAEVERVAPSYNRLVYVPPAAPTVGPYLNPELDVQGLEGRYLDSRPEVVWIDDFLAPATLEALRDFCLQATVWKKEYPNGYLGATLKDGFASPLLLAIAEDLRQRFPRIFGKHALEQAWAFKYDSTMKGINVHADFASVNVNFWITPDAACKNPDTGGLIVWDKESPRDWAFQRYNGDEAQIRRFLSESGAKAIRIPYRSNRCVLFNSTLFHETDRFEFNDAYADRRINVTLLYGKGLKTR